MQYFHVFDVFNAFIGVFIQQGFQYLACLFNVLAEVIPFFDVVCPFCGCLCDDLIIDVEDGKIVKAGADSNVEQLNQILDTDEGARYIGEFSLGLNPFILHPMKDTLFDEKIAGSFHFTPGQCYDEAPNGNDSSIHWDLVLIQRKEYGGGEIYFDDKLIRKDGVFIDAEMEKQFSKENLKGSGLE